MCYTSSIGRGPSLAMAHPSGRCRTTTRRRSGQSSTHSPFFRLTDAKFLSEYTVTGVWLDSHFVPIPVVSFHDLIVFFHLVVFRLVEAYKRATPIQGPRVRTGEAGEDSHLRQEKTEGKKPDGPSGPNAYSR